MRLFFSCQQVFTCKIALGITFILVFCPSISYLRAEVQTDNTFGYRFQFLTFMACDSNKTDLEVYAQIPTRNLTFIENRNGYVATYSITLNVYDRLGLLVDAQFFQNAVHLASLNNLPLEVLRFNFSLSSGEHKIVVYVTDLSSLDSYVFNKLINVPDYCTPKPQMSDLQLALSIKRSGESSSFSKHGWHVFPNVSNIFVEPFNTLFFYVELYNLSGSPNTSRMSLNSVLTIEDIGGKTLKTIISPNLKFGPNNAVIGQIPIDELGGGHYKLTLGVTDSDNGQSIEKSTHFAVTGPSS